jgi:hypothetical protein
LWQDFGAGKRTIRSAYSEHVRTAAHVHREGDGPQLGWEVHILWSSGNTQIVMGFATAQAAAKWGVRHCENWLEYDRQASEAP